MTDRSPLRPPPLSRLALEGVLPAIEWAGFLTGGSILALAPRGSGRSVLVLPGFTASDAEMAPLRAVLSAKGHAPAAWRLGTNLGAHPHVIDGMTRRLADLHRRSGRKVSIVGWSLGGMFARELARRAPEEVHDVVTLASPFRMRDIDRNHVSSLYDMLGPNEDALLELEVPEESRVPVPVPCTSLYSRLDGIVRWHACIDAGGPNRESIEVRSSHSGFSWNLAAVYAVCDRLAQADGEWSPFRPPAFLRPMFPTPTAWRPKAAAV